MDTKSFVAKYAVERRGTDCEKWDRLATKYGDPNLISMWVADMEFRTADAIIEALSARAEHGAFGYGMVPAGYYEAFSGWMQQRHGVSIEQEWVRFSPGVIPALFWMVNAFTNPGDAVMIMTPVYYPFHNAVKDTGRTLVAVDLLNHNGHYTMDFEGIESAIVHTKVRMLILCSPHNPVGRVWTEEELEQLLNMCERHGVLVVSDEIHMDIILGEKPFVSVLSVAGGCYAEKTIVLSSASKTFNLASFLHSHIVIPGEELRQRYDAYAQTVNRAENNTLGMLTTMEGYLHGSEWLDSLLDVVRDNYQYLVAELNEKVPQVVVPPLEGTYLLLLDIREVLGDRDTKTFIQDDCHLAVDYGEWFGENFVGFVRLNLATEPRYVHQAVANIIAAAQA